MRTERANREVRTAGDRYLCLIRVYPPNPLQAGPRLTLRTAPFYTMTDPELLPSLLSSVRFSQQGRLGNAGFQSQGEKGPHPAIGQHQREEEVVLGQARAGHLLGAAGTCSQPVRGSGGAPDTEDKYACYTSTRVHISVSQQRRHGGDIA